MENGNMTAIRREAHSLLDEIPASELSSLTGIMWGIQNLAEPKIRTENSESFKRLEQLIRPIPGLDEEKELAEWREEKYGVAGSD